MQTHNFDDFGNASDYARAVSAERRIFDGCFAVHDLPPIFHYWSDRYLRPKTLACGFENSTALFASCLDGRFDGDRRQRRFCSLGCGNGDLEIDLARKLYAEGHREFIFDCLDLNPLMRDRAKLAASRAGLASHFHFQAADLNCWTPLHEYDAVIANQSLHHVVNLENLFTEVKQALRDDGNFIVSDMIGRNGHQRWPEAREMIRDYWKSLPPSYRINRKLNRYEHEFADWDCSVEGFEGVRAQDVLPQLIHFFEFHLFLPFGNLIDPFIDRSFGPNFDASRPEDRAFIDLVHSRDENEIASGRLKPVHLMAVLGKAAAGAPVFAGGLTPASCVRHPQDAGTFLSPGADCSIESLRPAYSPLLTADRAVSEIDVLAPLLRDVTSERDTLAQWAQTLDRECERLKGIAAQSQKDFEERTEWAFRLDSALTEASGRIRELNDEMSARTVWALRLEEELNQNIAWTSRLCAEVDANRQRIVDLERENAQYVRRPWTILPHICRGLARFSSRKLFRYQP